MKPLLVVAERMTPIRDLAYGNHLTIQCTRIPHACVSSVGFLLAIQSRCASEKHPDNLPDRADPKLNNYSHNLTPICYYRAPVLSR